MKSAKEMFEKLGYMQREEHYSETALIVYTNGKDYIYFDYDKKFSKEGFGTFSFIDMKLLQAINKQVEELGWK